MFLRTAAAVGSTLPPRSGVSDLNFPSPAPDLRSLFIERDSLTAIIYFFPLPIVLTVDLVVDFEPEVAVVPAGEGPPSLGPPTP